MKKFSAVFLVSAAFYAFSAAENTSEKAVITGDQMEIIKSGREVVFSGNAVVTRGLSVLKADWLKQDKATGLVEARGNVYLKTFSQDGELIVGRGGRARYLPEDGKGEFWESRPNVVYYVKSSTEPLNLTADKIDFDNLSKIIHAEGAFEIITSSGSAFAQDAVYRQQEMKVFLTGQPRPRIIYDEKSRKGEYTADLITLSTEKRDADLQGHVHGKIYDFEKR